LKPESAEADQPHEQHCETEPLKFVTGLILARISESRCDTFDTGAYAPMP
jgi:hypothetical protein